MIDDLEATFPYRQHQRPRRMRPNHRAPLPAGSALQNRCQLPRPKGATLPGPASGWTARAGQAAPISVSGGPFA